MFKIELDSENAMVVAIVSAIVGGIMFLVFCITAYNMYPDIAKHQREISALKQPIIRVTIQMPQPEEKPVPAAVQPASAKDASVITLPAAPKEK